MQNTVPRVELHEDALRELDDAVAFINADWDGRGNLFLDAFTVVVERLLVHPRAGRAIGRRARKWVMLHWRYTIYYTIEEYGIFIRAVAHHARRPNYWRNRLR